MRTTRLDFAKEVLAQLKEHIQVEISLETPPELALGDYALPCFTLAKDFKKSPQAIAQELAEKITPAPPIARVVAQGPYLNIFLDKAVVAERVLTAAPDRIETGKKVLFEYPSPNTNKPFHLGHLRNMLLGQATSNIVEQAGNTVVRTNLNNDRGVHICKSMLAYDIYGENKTPQDLGLKPDHFVGHWYVRFAQEAEKNPELEVQAQELLRKWEAGDAHAQALWKKMNDWAYEGFKETFLRLGVTFDKQYYESGFYEQAKETVKQAHEKGIFSTDDKGNIVAELGKLGTKVVLRADGTAVYATQDVGLGTIRQVEFAPDEQVYVVAEEQNYYFEQLFAIFDLLGFTHTRHHLSYGLISLPSGRMKSREGTVVDCDELLNEMEELAAAEIKKRHPDISEEELAKRSIAIGHGALRFFILKYEPKTAFVYNPEESMSFEGETGPYVQYAAARIASILRELPAPLTADYGVLVADEEYALITALRNTQDVIQEAAQHYKPHLVARHAMKIAQDFTTFYHEHHIKTAETSVRDARLILIKTTREHLTLLLGLLGITTLEEM